MHVLTVAYVTISRLCCDVTCKESTGTERGRGSIMQLTAVYKDGSDAADHGVLAPSVFTYSVIDHNY